ncbi:MAG: tRNA (N6-isopentenyl adenosine(37)-C2)-methylthiotransferase MiaB [Desulfococcaceae bacterium]
MSARHLYIHTIGCQMNVYDSERIARLLEPLGYVKTGSVKTADLIILNTCAIREKAEQKAFSFLGRLADLKQKKPDMIIAVGGCVAQQEGARILKRVPFLDAVFGTGAIGRLPRIIEKVEKRRIRVIDVDMNSPEEEFDLPEPYPVSESVSRFVTIMQGCDNYCTYCVVPYVRGREHSRTPERILREIEALVRSGVREVTLLGQNVNSYGKKEGLCSFAELLAQINRVDGLSRIRFTTSHPKDLSRDLMLAFRDLEKLCRHIHLPVQSGSDQVLKRMNRKYTRDHYLHLVEQLRGICPDVAITSDIIAGFPGESRADFEMTLDLIRTVGYDGLFAFVYSDRPNAPAANFSEKIPEEEQHSRLQEILDLQEHFTLEKNRLLIGNVREILVDGMSRRQTSAHGSQPEVQMSGRTTENKIVNFMADSANAESLMGRLLNLEIEDAFSHSLRGKPPAMNNL